MRIDQGSMDFIRCLTDISPQHRNCAVTIGNFDGVHLGHQQLLTVLTEHAKPHNLPMVLITFEPHPQEYFNPTNPPARLTNLREKVGRLKSFPLNCILCLRFNASLVNLSAGEFIKTILVSHLGLKYLIVGKDFRFGYQREGTFQLLQAAAKHYGFAVEGMDSVNIAGERVSSNRIRVALREGNLSLAATLLGRPYSIRGRVMHGAKRGHLLGFPTANINLHRITSPLRGVFAVRVLGLGKSPLTGMANIGTRPTVGGIQTLLEVHIFDFDQSIYGRELEIIFVEKLREEQRFVNLEELKKQLSLDATEARRLLKGRNYD